MEKDQLLNLVSRGKINKVIQYLLQLKLDKEDRTEITHLAARYRDLTKGTLNTTKDPDQQNVDRAQVYAHLIDFIQQLENETPIPRDKKKAKKRWIVYLGIIGSIASIIGLLLYIPDLIAPSTSLQLTVLVEDEQGRVIIENSGKLIIDFDGDRRDAMIGENGRTNFEEIPAHFKGDSLTVVFDVPNYELVNQYNTFLFTGKSIHLVVRRTLRDVLIRNQLRDAATQEPIEGAKVLIGTVAKEITDKDGIFKATLSIPISDSIVPTYSLTISKQGYQTCIVNYQADTPILLHKITANKSKNAILETVKIPLGKYASPNNTYFIDGKEALLSYDANKTLIINLSDTKAHKIELKNERGNYKAIIPEKIKGQARTTNGFNFP